MMNRIDAKFRTLREQGKKGLIAYISAGDPDIHHTEKLAYEFEKSGVDILELGVPFSDPLADGIVNQLAAQRALEAGTTPRDVLNCVSRIRRKSELPVVLYVYFNLIHKWGTKAFLSEARKAGVDGLLVLDLPPEEAGNYQELSANHEVCSIQLIAPTTPESRIPEIVQRATGFIYYVSREGVTGMQKKLSDTIQEQTNRIKKVAHLPIAIGFGISNPEQAAKAASYGDAAVVGSAIVTRIGELGRKKEMVPTVGRFVKSLAHAVHS